MQDDGSALRHRENAPSQSDPNLVDYEPLPPYQPAIDSASDGHYSPPWAPPPLNRPQHDPPSDGQYDHPHSPSSDEEQSRDADTVPGADAGPVPNTLVELDLDQLMASTHLDFLQTKLSFIQDVRNATLDDGHGLSGDALQRLRNPPQSAPEINDSVTQLALTIFIALEHSSQETYEKIWRAIEKCYESSLPSFYKTKKLLAKISGVESVVNDMCINSCAAFVGPYSHLEECPDCQEPRFDQVKLLQSHGQKKIPRAIFHTIPIGPQLQAQ